MIHSFLRIVRWPNLLIVGLIQGLIYLKLIHPDLSIMSWTDMMMLMSITMLITASGFLINDYYDTEMDKINRPHRQIAGASWSLRVVKQIYIGLVVMGGLIAIWLAWRLGFERFLFLYLLATISLWFYSYSLKCLPVVGNIWVALFAAGLVIIVGIPDIIGQGVERTRPEFWWYTGFAFLSTWYREIVKDLEDMEGDSLAGCKTFVVRYGATPGKRMAVAVGLALIFALTAWSFLQSYMAVRILLILLLLLVLVSLFFLGRATQSHAYHRVSMLIKSLMVGGILIILCL